MMKSNRSISLSLFLGVTLISIAAPRESAAAFPRITSIYSYEYADTFVAGINNIVDLDQRREAGTYLGDRIEGLPGDGISHCAPTVAADVLGWISRTGYTGEGETLLPSLAPRANEWRPPASSASTAVKRAYNSIYNEQTQFIRDLGIEMGTNPLATGGTSDENLRSVLNRRLPDGFKVNLISDAGCDFEMSADGTRTVDREIGLERIHNEIASGNLVLLHYNKYDDYRRVPGLGFLKPRPNSGHITFVSYVQRPKDESVPGILFTTEPSDLSPVSGTMALTQSLFSDTSINGIPQSESSVNYEGDGSVCSFYGKKATVIPTTTPGIVQVIEAITVISPPEGSSFVGFRPTEVMPD
jgi:hypothetical protein